MQIWETSHQKDRCHWVSLHEVPWYAVLVEEIAWQVFLRPCNWPGLGILYRPGNRIMGAIVSRFYCNPVLELPLSDDQYRLVCPEHAAILLNDD
jgi:hypothetical protein